MAVASAKGAPANGSVALQVFRGDPAGGAEERFEVPMQEGMVVLDAIHYIQAHFAPDLACRWNCKAAKCGSCSAEVNGRPRLMCKTRVDEFDGEIHVWPMKAFPLIKDLELQGQPRDPALPAIPERGSSLPDGRGRRRADLRVPQMYRVLSLSGRLSRPAQPRRQEPLLRSPLHGPDRWPGDASARYAAAHRAPPRQGRGRHVQHHQVLPGSLSGAHQDHRQCHHSAEGAHRHG